VAAVSAWRGSIRGENHKEEDMGSINDGGDDDYGTSQGGIHMYDEDINIFTTNGRSTGIQLWAQNAPTLILSFVIA
jgi:hypothetical protein